jgi:hypothetical protein
VLACLLAPTGMERALDITEWQYFEPLGGTALFLIMWAQAALGAIAVIALRRRP